MGKLNKATKRNEAARKAWVTRKRNLKVQSKPLEQQLGALKAKQVDAKPEQGTLPYTGFMERIEALVKQYEAKPEAKPEQQVEQPKPVTYGFVNPRQLPKAELSRRALKAHATRRARKEAVRNDVLAQLAKAGLIKVDGMPASVQANTNGTERAKRAWVTRREKYGNNGLSQAKPEASVQAEPSELKALTKLLSLLKA